MTTVPSTPRLDDWNIELVNLSDGATFILGDEIISVSTVTEPGATRRKLLSGQIECSAGTASDPSYAAQSLGWGGWQAIRFVPYGDTSQEFWGLVAKQKESYSNRPGRIPLTLAPIGYLLHSRVVYTISGGAPVPISGASLTVDDYAKKLVRNTALPGTCTNDADGNSRDWNWGTLAVQADASASAKTMGAGHTGIDEMAQFLDDVLNALINIDLDFYWELLPSVSGGTITFTFNTSCSVGTDRTSGAGRWVINDFAGEEPTGERQEDKIGMYNAQHNRGLGHVETHAASIASYGRWESVTDAQEDDGAKEDLKPGLTKVGHKVSYAVVEDWMSVWNEGDKMLRNNVRLGIAESSERLAEVHMSANGSDKLIKLDLVWGDREAQQTKKKGGGRGGKLTPREFVPIFYGTPVSVAGANAEGTSNFLNRADHEHKLTLTLPAPATVSPNSGDFSLESADGSIVLSTPGAGRVDLSIDISGIAAPADASFVVVSLDADLTDERVLVAGDGLTLADGGAGGNLTLDVGAGDGITVNANDVALTTPGTCSVSSSNIAAGNHTHAITTASDVSAGIERILASDASGQLELARLRLGNTSVYLENDTTNMLMVAVGHVRYEVGGAANGVRITTTAIRPHSDASAALGTTTVRFSNSYVDDSYITNDAHIGTGGGVILADGNETTKVLTGNGTRYVGNSSPSLTGMTLTTLTVNGHIVVTGNVDGVDVSAHTHSIGQDSENTGNQSVSHNHTLTFTPTASGSGGGSHTHDIVSMCTGGAQTVDSDHYHIIPASTYTTGSTNIDHTHNYDKTDTPTGNQSASHTHSYMESQTGTLPPD